MPSSAAPPGTREVDLSATAAPSPHVQVLAVGEDLATAFKVAQEDLALRRLPAGEKVENHRQRG